MDLPTIWFIILGYLFAGFFLLEGFDYGVGILSPLISKSEEDRRQILASIGGFWDGNEVWLVTAGAVMFAAFPHWYATLFSGFFPVFVLILLALIMRGIGLKLRNLKNDPAWRNAWDWSIFGGSLLSPFLWGIVVGNMLRGVPIDGGMIYRGGTLALFNPFAVMTGVALTFLFILHGAIFLSLKLTGDVLKQVQSRILGLYIVSLATAVAFLVYCAVEIGILRHVSATCLAILAALALVACLIVLKKKPLAAFVLSGLTIISLAAMLFVYLYPNVLISTLDPAWSMDVHAVSSSPYSLKIMSIVALIFIPTVALYQGWTYWVLRQRITKSDLH